MQAQGSNVVFIDDYRITTEATDERENTDVVARDWAHEVRQLRLQRTILLIAVVALFAIAVLEG